MKRNLGGKYIEVAIDIPSGKIAYGNDFRDLWMEIDKGFNVNDLVGIKKTTESYGKHGLFHGFIGNTCPGLYMDGDRISIASPKMYDDNDNELPREEWGIDGKEVGSICTDLWWYSMADYDDYVDRGGDKAIDVIGVPPGRYVLNHDIESSGWHSYPYVYATIERSDEPVNKWKMPEEDVGDRLMALIPGEIIGKDSFLYIEPRYRPRQKGARYSDPADFYGYRIWGHMGKGAMGEVLSDGSSESSLTDVWVEYLAQESELYNLETLAKSVIQNWNENHCRECFMKNTIKVMLGE